MTIDHNDGSDDDDKIELMHDNRQQQHYQKQKKLKIWTMFSNIRIYFVSSVPKYYYYYYCIAYVDITEW